jgi:WhiB family redox-sensing transcriptional regulator
MSQAACRGEELELFFPQRGVAATTMARAREVCAGCPVRLECLDFAKVDAEIMGVWGGTTKQERQASRRVAQSSKSAIRRYLGSSVGFHAKRLEHG